MRITSFMGAMLLSLLMAGTVEKANAGLFVSITVAPPPLVVYSQPPLCRDRATCGRPDTGAGTKTRAIIFGCPERGCSRPSPACCGRPATGAGVTKASMSGTKAIGARMSGSMAASTTATATAATVSRADIGAEACTAITAPSMNVGVSVSINVYSKVVVGGGHSQTSFNGGKDGIRAKPSAHERAYANEHHIGATQQQREHHQHAAKDPGQKFGTNHGKPAAAATSKAGDFSSAHTVGAKSAGTGFKPTALKTQGGPVGNKTGAGAGTKHLESVKHGSALNKTGKTGGANFGAANSFHSDKLKSNGPSKGAALQGAKRPGPAPHPVARPVAKAPVDKKKH